MAFTARNITIGATDYNRPTLDRNVSAFLQNSHCSHSYKAVKSSVTGWPSAEVPDFHLQVPTGKLYFRSLTGALVDKPVSNIASLGDAMSKTDDYYLCAAKRYFQFMTGIEIALTIALILAMRV